MSTAVAKKKYFVYSQNNSGGRYIGSGYVVIEAPSAKMANMLAQEYAGIYFNGVSEGQDCHCCGDRWYPVDEDDAQDTPLVSKYGFKTPDGKFGFERYYTSADKMEWSPDTPAVTYWLLSEDSHDMFMTLDTSRLLDNSGV